MKFKPSTTDVMAKSMLYTATGDRGETSLVGGQRVSKTSVRLEAYGTIDEFSAFLGVALSHHGCPSELKGQMLEIQDKLFEIGCYLATDSAGVPDAETVRGLSEDDVRKVEGWIDALDEQTPKIGSFVLPGGCEESAHLHVARTVCRRAERRILSLAAEAPVSGLLLRYVNRLSDYLFIAARFANFMAGVEEITWRPGGRK